MLAWMVEQKDLEPRVPVRDKAERKGRPPQPNGQEPITRLQASLLQTR